MSELAVDIGIYGRPYFGERVSGDLAFAKQRSNIVFLAIVDGLGHGASAHKIAQRAQDYLLANWHSNIEEVLLALHEELSGVGGAAIGLAVIDLGNRVLRYVGVGNTVLRKIGAASEGLLSIEGVVGARIRKPLLQEVDIEASDLLVLYTDGVSGIKIRDVRQLAEYNATYGARQIVQKYGSPYDDATCILVKVSDAS